MKEYIFARLKEASTWRGIVALVTSSGVVVSPEQTELIVSVGLGLIGLLGTLPDKK